MRKRGDAVRGANKQKEKEPSVIREEWKGMKSEIKETVGLITTDGGRGTCECCGYSLRFFLSYWTCRERGGGGGECGKQSQRLYGKEVNEGVSTRDTRKTKQSATSSIGVMAPWIWDACHCTSTAVAALQVFRQPFRGQRARVRVAVQRRREQRRNRCFGHGGRRREKKKLLREV